MLVGRCVRCCKTSGSDQFTRGVARQGGALAWEFQTDASRRNAGWVLTADRKFNSQMLFWSNWREAPIVATMQQFGIGAILSSPLVVGGTVYFGSTDGNMYALE